MLAGKHLPGRVLTVAEDGVASEPARRDRLAQRRKALGLTQEQLGVERTTVVRWERGETQLLPWLRLRLARALGVSADRIEGLLTVGGVSARRQDRAAVVPRQLPAGVADFTG